MNFLNNPNRIPERYGFLIFIGLILLFGVMMAFGLHHHVELRALNLVIMAVGIYYGLNKYRETHGSHMNYFRGLITGSAMSAVASTGFGLFMFIWMKLDSSLMQSIIDNEPMGHYLNPYIASFIVSLEGLFSGILITFLCMNAIDSDSVNDPVGESK